MIRFFRILSRGILPLLMLTTPLAASDECEGILICQKGARTFSTPANAIPGVQILYIVSEENANRCRLSSRKGPGLDTCLSKEGEAPTLEVLTGLGLQHCLPTEMLTSEINRMPHCHDDPPPRPPFRILAGLEAVKFPMIRTYKLGIHAILEKTHQSHWSAIAGVTYIPNAATRSSKADLLEFSIGPRFYFDRPSKRFRLFATAALLSTIQPDFGFGVYPAVGLRFDLDNRPFEIEMGYHDAEGSRLDSFMVQVRLAIGRRPKSGLQQ